MKNVCNSICDYEYISEKWDMLLPFLSVRAYDFDSDPFLEASGTQQNDYLAFNRTGRWFSVFEFS